MTTAQAEPRKSTAIRFARFVVDRYYRPGDPELDTIASRGTLATWRWQGRGPKYTKIGTRILYRGSDLNDFLDAGVVEPADRARMHEERARALRESRS